MRRSLAALAVVAAAAIVASGCGGGGGDHEAEASGTSTTTTTVRHVDVSTPEAVVAALANAGITCTDLVPEDPESFTAWDMQGVGAHCTIGADTLGIAVYANDDSLS